MNIIVIEQSYRLQKILFLFIIGKIQPAFKSNTNVLKTHEMDYERLHFAAWEV